MYNQSIIGNLIGNELSQVYSTTASALDNACLRLGLTPGAIKTFGERRIYELNLEFDGQILEEYTYQNQTLIRLLRQGNNFLLETFV